MNDSMTLHRPCLHPEVRYDAEKDNYYCQSCHGGMGLAYYKVARERDALKAERQGWIGFTENWVKDPNSTMPTTREDWSKWMAGWNALKLDTIKQSNQIDALKGALSRVKNCNDFATAREYAEQALAKISTK